MSEENSITLTEDAKKVIEIVSGMTILEVSNLVKAMEEEFGVSAAAPVAAMGVAPAAAAEAAPAEEKTEFDVVLSNAGDKKIAVIKVVREITSLGLKDAKQLVDGVVDEPNVLKKALKKDDAEKMKADLEAAGATVELK